MLNMYLQMTDFWWLCLFFSWICAELSLPDIPAHVELHALKAAQRVCEEHRGGDRPCPELQLRLPAGEHHERVLPPEELQPDSDRRTAGHQGLRHRHASGWVENHGMERGEKISNEGSGELKDGYKFEKEEQKKDFFFEGWRSSALNEGSRGQSCNSQWSYEERGP